MCGKVIRKVRSNGSEESEGIPGLPTAVRLCMGRPGLAISSDRVRDRERCITLLEHMVGGDGEIWADREEMEEWLDMMCLFLRDMALTKIAQESPETHARPLGDTQNALLNADMQEFVSEMAAPNAIRDILEAYDKVIALKRVLGFNLNKAIAWNYVAGIMQNLIRLKRAR
jgi:hypothetical protein